MDQHAKDIGTREKILESAQQVFSEQGYDKTSMKDIAEKAGVNKALLFYYYSSKENLYQEIIRSLFDKFYRVIVDAKEELEQIPDFEQRFYRLMELYSSQFSQTRNIMFIIIRGLVQYEEKMMPFMKEMIEKIRRPLVEMIEDGIRKGILRNMNPYFTAAAIIGIFQIFYRMPCGLEPHFDDRTIFEETMKFTYQGILARSNTHEK